MGALEPPPIGHPVYIAGLVLGAIVGLIAVRPALRLGDGPSAAWMPAGPSSIRQSIAALGVGTLGLMAFLAILGGEQFGWPPVSAERRAGWGLGALGVIGAVLGVVGVLRAASGGAGPGPGQARWPAWLVLAVVGVVMGGLYGMAVVWTRLFGAGADSAARVEGAIAIGAAVIATLAIVLPLGAMDRRGQGFSASFIAAGMLLASAGALLGSGSIALGQMTLGLACPVLALAGVSALTRGGSIGAGAITVAAAGLAGLLLSGQMFSRLPLHSGVIIAGAPVAAAIVDATLGRWIARRLGAKWAAAARIGAAAVVAGVGMASAISVEGRGDAYEY